MIDISYERSTNETKVQVSSISTLPPEDFPLTALFAKTITGEFGWETKILPGHWCTWKGGSTGQWDTTITTARGKTIAGNKFNVELDGDFIEKSLWYFVKNKPHSKGMVIGSHDGSFGHWVYPVFQGLTDAILIEGSLAQYDKVSKNYETNSNVKCIHQIVTTDGSDVEWFEGGEGYTDTVVKSVIDKFLNDSQVTKTNRSSISINELIKNEADGELDWIHFDVEGYDADLIMAMEYRPTIIIFETMHFSVDKFNELKRWFAAFGYQLHEDSMDAIAIRIR
jgi:hypothetical protein